MENTEILFKIAIRPPDKKISQLLGKIDRIISSL